jgi:hypothetical protein
MPIEYIPNQPIIFEHPIGLYPCLNNDTTKYNQLAQPGDKICVQWKLKPCVEDTFCEPTMYRDGGTQTLDTWIDASGTGAWISGGYDNAVYSYGSTINNPVFTNGNTNYVAGRGYAFTFTIDYITGNLPLTIEFLNSNIGPQQFTQIGTYTIYFIPLYVTSAVSLYFGTYGNDVDSSNQVIISNMSCLQYTECWFDDVTDSKVSSWSYDYENNNGKFCSLYDPDLNTTAVGDLVNNNAYQNAGHYYQVDIVVSDMTSGGLEVELGGTLLGTITSNGQYSFYGIPINASYELRLKQIDGFDGCVSNVNVLDFGDPTTRFNVWLAKLDNSIVSDTVVPTYEADRIIFCELYEDLNINIDSSCELLKVALYEECVDDVYTIEYSVNYISYNLNGWECTKVVEAWNDGFAFGFYFGPILTPVFTLYQRLRVLQFNPKYSNEVEEYLYSSGGRTRTYAESQKYRDCWFDYVDEYTHDCIRTQLLSDKLSIDSYFFFYRTEEYEPEWNNNFKYNLAQSRVELIHENAIFGSYCGTQSNAQCPPQIETVNTCTLTTLALDFSLELNNPYIWTAMDAFLDNTPIGTYDFTDGTSRLQFMGDLIAQLNLNYGGFASGTIQLVGTSVIVNISSNITPVSTTAPYIIWFTDYNTANSFGTSMAYSPSFSC